MPAGHAVLYCFNEKLTKSNYSSGQGKVFGRAGECVRDRRPREVGWCGYECILKAMCLLRREWECLCI